MKARFKYELNEHGFRVFELCGEYPNCNCEGHYVWEKTKPKEPCCDMSEDVKSEKEGEGQC